MSADQGSRVEVNTVARDEPFIVVEDLSIKFPTADGMVNAVSDLSYSVEMGKTLGVVGESGSGKSVSNMAVLGLHDPGRTQIEGSIRVDGTEIVGLDRRRLQQIRGNDVAMIFQDALAALHPFHRVGRQIAESYRMHHPSASKRDARRRAIEMLDRVGISQPESRVDDYPHQFSGGMRQRVMIAMALVNDPKVLIADEPTTALDVTVQAQILDLLQDLQRDFGSAIVMITHDLGVVAEMADDVLVMYAGRAVEYGACRTILSQPRMPYTWGLLGSVPDLETDPGAELAPIPGLPPSMLAPPTGCPFHPRCTYVDRVADGLCSSELPVLEAHDAGHQVRCHLGERAAELAAAALGERPV